jgi:hypothetical protein
MDSIIPTAEEMFLIIEEIFKPAERHVRFGPDVLIPISSSQDTYTRDRWYTKEEVTSFKLKVQDLTVSLIRGEKKRCHKKSVLGLEHCCDLNRLKQKQLAVAHVLKAQRTLKGHLLAEIAHDSATWHKEIAFIQGLQDYCAVYDPSLASSVPPMHASPPPLPKLTSMPKKRIASPSFLRTGSKRLRTTPLSAE